MGQWGKSLTGSAENGLKKQVLMGSLIKKQNEAKRVDKKQLQGLLTVNNKRMKNGK